MIIEFETGDNTQITKNFKRSEYQCGCGIKHWNKIDSELVLKHQEIRNNTGKVVKVTSGYRCRPHNKNVGGSSKSYHMEGRAADIQIKDTDVRIMGSEAGRAQLRVGHYKKFVHTDVSGRPDFLGKY